MAFGLSGWRPRHLLGSWIGYWVTAAAVKLSPAIAAGWRASREGGKGSISAGFENNTLHLTIVEAGKTIYSGTTDIGTLMLWVAGPPLLLWVLWLVTRKSPARTRPGMGTTSSVERYVPSPRPPSQAMDSHALGEGPAPAAPSASPRRDTPAPRQYDDRRIR